MLTYLLIAQLLQFIRTQICASPVHVLDTLTQGSCVSDSSVSYLYGSAELGSLNGLQSFTVSLWFRPDQKVSGRTEQALFRVSGDIAIVDETSPDGVRLGLFFTADADQNTNIRMQYSKLGQNMANFVQALPYTEQKWIFAYAGLDYVTGVMSFFAWQPFTPSVQVNPQPYQLAANFNTQLTANAKLQLLYWGSKYPRFCGSINLVRWYPNYVEKGYQHNWINMAFYSQTYTYTVAAHYRLQDGNGQLLRDSTGLNNAGCLGATSAVEASNDPTFTTNELNFGSGQFATLPGVKFASSNLAYGVSFYFKTTATMYLFHTSNSMSDGDNGDLIKDLVLLKRISGGTDVLGVMLYTASSNQFATKIKLHGILYTLPSVMMAINQWHFISVRVAYPGAVTELANVIFDVVLENNIFAAHQVTTLITTYKDQASDTIVLGSKSNGYLGNLWMSNVQFVTSYTAYVMEDVANAVPISCNTDCEISMNTPVYSQCLRCTNSKFLNNGLCIAACITGPTALTDNNNNVCQNCPYQCATCKANSDCNSCTVGYYLQNTGKSCVISSLCASSMVGDPATLKCTSCGNGKHEGAEKCDDGNFTAGDGCSACAIDAGYVCDGNQPDQCQLECGDGVVQVASGEACDDANQKADDGCTTCQIDPGYKCTGAPSVCKLLCGDGNRDAGEDCDDNNNTNFDGCSSQCTIEPGYACVGNTPDVCTVLCGNGIVDFGEECDDGNSKQGDGCTDCVVDSGWICPNNLCQKVCGNGVRDLGEQCDNGVSLPGTGCSNCKVDTDYVCRGGSTSSQDVCKVIPDICGDGIKKSTERCDDGNTVDGDGCSLSCQVEVGFICSGGSQYSKDNCYEICGDGRKVGNEQCDDGNVFGGDGCNEFCSTESLYQCVGGNTTQRDKCYYSCGNGSRDDLEECDDDNTDSGDGCSSECRIEDGWGCTVKADSQRDECFKCVPGCAMCIDKTAQGCSTCYEQFYLHVSSQMCLAGCPFGHIVNLLTSRCDQCPEGCQLCKPNLVTGGYACLQCRFDYYLEGDICYPTCPNGYFNQLDVMSGNHCIKCTSPCAVCSSASDCQECGDGYYIEQSGACKECGMGDKCLRCDPEEQLCKLCAAGYYRDEATCIKMEKVCGDGYHHPTEICDDGNTDPNDGCGADCRVESNWDCILYDPQGPDVCYQQAPPNITSYITKIHYDTLFVEFSRPLAEAINFTNFTSISILGVDDPNQVLVEPVNDEGIVVMHDKANMFIPYEYNITQIDPQTISIRFDYKVTIQDKNATINITEPSRVVDVFNWSLTGQINPATPTSRLLQENTTFMLVNAPLQYYIHYDEVETAVMVIVSWVCFAFALIGVLASAYYSYEIGEGRNWKIIEIFQTLAMLRFVNWRYGENLDLLFQRMDIFNGTFIFNFFSLFMDDQSTNSPDKFIFNAYNEHFLLSGGGRFISWLAYLLVLLGINQFLYRVMKFEALEYYTEQISKIFTYQGYIKLLELLFFDLSISIMLQISSTSSDINTITDLVGIVLASLFLAAILALMGLATWKFIFNPKLTRVQGFYDKFGTLFDGLSFDSPYTKFYCLVPYVQKLASACVLVFLDDALIQIVLIAGFRVLPFIPSYKNIPFFFIEILARVPMISPNNKEIVYETILIAFILTTLAYDDYYSPKDQKQAYGWALMGLIVVLVLIQCAWVRFAYLNIEKLSPPPVPEHEEVHDDQQSDEDDYYHRKAKVAVAQDAPKAKKHHVNVLASAQKMEDMQNDFFG